MLVLIAFIVIFSIVMNQRKRLIQAETQLHDLENMWIGKWMDRTEAVPNAQGPDRLAKDWRARAYIADSQPPLPVAFPAQSLTDLATSAVTPPPHPAQAAEMPTAKGDASTPTAITVTVQLR